MFFFFFFFFINLFYITKVKKFNLSIGKFELGLIFFDGFESPIHLSIIFAYSWSSQNPGNVVRKKSILAEISGN